MNAPEVELKLPRTEIDKEFSENGPSLPLSADREAKLFWRLRGQLAFRQFHLLMTTAHLRVALVFGLTLFFWCGLFLLFYEGFLFLVQSVGGTGAAYHAETVQFIFHVFFASLNVMLIFSSAIVLYSGIFRSRETAFLLTKPVRPARIVLHKFQESLFYSSWGFFLLGSPLIVAYGIVVAAPWYYYVLLLPLMICFVYIPCCFGSLACLLVVYRLPRFRRLALACCALAVILVSFRSIYLTVGDAQGEIFGESWFRETVERFRFTRMQWLPSTWLTSALLEAARGDRSLKTELPWLESCKYLAVLASNSLLLHIIVVWVGDRFFREAYTRLATRGTRTARKRTAWVDRFLNSLLWRFPQPVRLLLIKDLRVFRRDPVQWSQFLIFFGLLALYFFNIDRFSYEQSDLSYRIWINAVSFLNLAVVGLILSTFTTRFIFPMLSLEGHRFWILGLLPIKRDTIVWGKFFFAAGGSWIPCATLVFLSDLMLKIPIGILGMHQIACLMLSIGLAAIAVGLGAAMPNLREESPSKIAAGFGGTLNLVLSATYIILIVSLTCLPVHFYRVIQQGFGILWTGGGLLRWVLRTPLDVWLVSGQVAALVLTGCACYFPMRAGLRAFRKMQF